MVFQRLAQLCVAATAPNCRFSRIVQIRTVEGISRLYFAEVNTLGVTMDRNFNAPLSPNELASLRGLGVDSKREISDSHRQLLLSMGLIVANGDELNLTEAGRHRLNPEGRAPTHSSTGFVEQAPGENVEPR
jgi:hypothetical protein